MHEKFLIENVKIINTLKTYVGIKGSSSQVGSIRFNYLTFNDYGRAKVYRDMLLSHCWHKSSCSLWGKRYECLCGATMFIHSKNKGNISFINDEKIDTCKLTDDEKKIGVLIK